MKRLTLTVGLLLLLLALLVLLAPFLIDLAAYRAQYLPLLEEALGRKVAFQDLRLTFIPRIGVRLTGLAIMDDPAFGQAPFVSVGSLDVGVKLAPLLEKRIEIDAVVLRELVVTLIKNRQGVLNASTVGKTGRPAAPGPDGLPAPSPGDGPLGALALLAVEQVQIEGGALAYRDQSGGEPREYVLQALDLTLESVGLDRTPRLHLSTVVQPWNLPVRLDGTAGPLTATADIRHADFTLGLGKAVLKIEGNVTGGRFAVTVTSPAISTADLPGVVPLQQPIVMQDVRIKAETEGSQMRVDHLSFTLFGGRVEATGALTVGQPAAPFESALTLRGVQIGPLLAAMRPGGLSMSGTAEAELTARGRGLSWPELTRSLEGAGRTVVRDGRIEGINLLKEAEGVLKVVGIQPDRTDATVFSLIEAQATVKQGIATLDRALMASRDFQATASGTIGFDQTLKLRATVTLSEALSRQFGGPLPVGRLILSNGRLTVPVVISGTLQHPTVVPDAVAMGSKVERQVERAVGGAVKSGARSSEQLIKKGSESLKKLFGQ